MRLTRLPARKLARMRRAESSGAKAAARRRRRRETPGRGRPPRPARRRRSTRMRHWMLRPSSTPFFARSVEWVRADVPFGNQVVDEIEHIYYTWNAPHEGRAAAEAACRRPVRPEGRSERSGCLAPADQAGLPRTRFRRRDLEADRAARPGWPAGAGDDLPPRARLSAQRRLCRLVRPHPHRSRLLSGPLRAAERRGSRAGDGPGDQRWRLLATFNAGFIYSDVNNGSTDNGRVNEPLAQGNATLIGYRDGRVAIKIWHGGPNAGPDVAWSRQSLPPIIWNGRLNPALNDSSQWGFTVGNAVRVWRTGVGIDRRGNLIFAAADGQTVITAGRDPAARGRGSRDAVRHQRRLAHPDHLHPPPRPRPDGRSGRIDTARHPLPHPRRPRLLRRLSPPARSGHRPLQVGIRRLRQEKRRRRRSGSPGATGRSARSAREAVSAAARSRRCYFIPGLDADAEEQEPATRSGGPRSRWASIPAAATRAAP